MTKKSRAYLQAKFITAYKPTQTDFTDQFDSYVHKDDGALQAAKITANIINGRNLITHNLGRKPIQVTFLINDQPTNFDWKRTDGLVDCDPLNNIVVLNSDVEYDNVEINIL